MSYKYNNNELAKLQLVENLDKIRKRNKDISSISIFFLQSTIRNNCINNQEAFTYSVVNPDISICIRNKYILKYHNHNNIFTYHNKNEKFIDNIKISPFQNQKCSFPYKRNKIYYLNKNRINCNKFFSMFGCIIESLKIYTNYQEEKNKNFIFDFENLDNLEKEINMFFGVELCHNILNEELEQLIPLSTKYNKEMIKF